MSQDVEFIAQTITNICKNISSKETLNRVLGTANEYVKLKKFPPNKEQWTDEQVDTYFSFIEKMAEIPEEFTQAEFDEMKLTEKLSSLGIETEDITDGLQGSGDMLGGIVKNMEEQNRYRDDLKCPYCQQMVYDNRNNKKSEKSPDFVCSTNDPVTCGGHSGKWRKSWWIDNSDIPAEWGLDKE